MQNSFMRWCEYWNLGQKVGRRTKAYLELQKMLAGDFTQEVNVPFSEAEALQWGNLGIPTKDYRDRYAELRAGCIFCNCGFRLLESHVGSDSTWLSAVHRQEVPITQHKGYSS